MNDSVRAANSGSTSLRSPEPVPVSALPGNDPGRSYEARVYSAHLPNRTVAFIFPESGIPFASGMFRIEYLRPATDADEAAFPSPNAESWDDVCPLCNQIEEWK